MKQAKLMYARIYNESHRTETIVLNMLSNKREKGLIYKYGRVLIDSCISHLLIDKCFDQSIQTTTTNFTLLFLLQKLTILSTIRSDTLRILAYT